VSNLQTDVTALEVKTTDITWASLSRTTFSGRVNIGSTPAGVNLYTTVPSEFGSGLTSSGVISSSGAITTTSTMSSTSGTSSFEALNVNTSLEVIQDAFIGNTLLVGRTVSSEKKIVLYDNNTDNDYDYTGMWTLQSLGKNYFNYEIDGTGGAFRWHYGNGLGNSRKKILDINDSQFYSYNATFSILNSQIGGQSQNITFTDDASGTFYMNWKTDPDVTASQDADARIVVDAGADGVEDDGTMSFISGEHSMLATTRGIEITANNALELKSTTGYVSLTTAANFYNISTDDDYYIYHQNPTGTVFFEIEVVSTIGYVNYYSAICQLKFTSDVGVVLGLITAPSTINGSAITINDNGATTMNSASMDISSLSLPRYH
jgi:hypothetical protein